MGTDPLVFIDISSILVEVILYVNRMYSLTQILDQKDKCTDISFNGIEMWVATRIAVIASRVLIIPN